MLMNVPTFLTWLRILAIPLLAGVFYLDLPVQQQNGIAAGMFVLFAVTDWLDGYLARRLGQTSAFGAFLDPVADKILVCACLLLLVDLHRADVFAALVIVGREITISALREWMARIGAGGSVAVHITGKIKTFVQMTAIPFLLYYDTAFGVLDTRLWGQLLLWVAVLLTVWSMVYYIGRALPEIRKKTDD